MAQKESRLSRKIMEALRERGAFVWKNHGNAHMMAGLPDIVGVYRGLFIGFETKTPEAGRDATSAKQRYVHGKIKHAGGACWVIISKEEALECLASLDSLIDGTIIDD